MSGISPCCGDCDEKENCVAPCLPPEDVAKGEPAPNGDGVNPGSREADPY